MSRRVRHDLRASARCAWTSSSISGDVSGATSGTTGEAITPSLSFPAGLTAREVEVLRLVAQGLANTQVAERLVTSPRTVNTYLTSIYYKLGGRFSHGRDAHGNRTTARLAGIVSGCRGGANAHHSSPELAGDRVCDYACMLQPYFR